jgi:hypothetical protein
VVEQAVVPVATLQGAAGIAINGLGCGSWPSSIDTDHGSVGGHRLLIAGLLAGLGMVIAAMFFGLAQGLRRRYDDVRAVFVVVQYWLGVLLLLSRGVWWTGSAVAWASGTAALAMFVRVPVASQAGNLEIAGPRCASP